MADKPKKKRKTQSASDGVIKPEFIQQAQRDMAQFGVGTTFRAVQVIEPELTGFIAIMAKDIAAHAAYDGRMPHAMANVLEERIVALALNVYQAQHDAVYQFYQDIIRGTPVAALNADPFPAPPAEGEEGGACAQTK